ncbi:MAG: CDP-alcohol phosphatidyltransferase family protein [Candidatus Nezhaarchaeota archaeon]|nr:CDP-alcohol phosphatidyltransferase family protein [Candidatus Nezhaarchaeota archaeon]
MLGKVRELYEEAIKPLGLALAHLGIAPNAVTLLGLIVAAGCCYALYLGYLYLGLGLLALACFIDVVDGALARASRKASSFGDVLDKVTDRYVEFALLLGLMLGGFLKWWWGVFTLFGMVMASYSRAEAQASLGRGSVKGGLMERQEKLLVLGIGMLAYSVHHASIDYAAIIVGSLSHLTVAQRLLIAWRAREAKE